MDPGDHGPDSVEGDGPEHRQSSGQMGGDGDWGAGRGAGKRRSWVRSLEAARASSSGATAAALLGGSASGEAVHLPGQALRCLSRLLAPTL